jgi:ring-1,2-phenylacetyl-CoA epoxidase subunit PaaC
MEILHYKNYLLHLADTNLILAQRLTEWCGHGPILEQDIALSNIALDLLGQATYFYDQVVLLEDQATTADDLAMLRTEREFKNLLIAELPNGDFSQTVAKLFFYESYYVLLLENLEISPIISISNIAKKALKESKYHLKWSSEWMIRLGDGTEESHARVQKSVDYLSPYLAEMFTPSKDELVLSDAGQIVAVESLKDAWLARINKVMDEAFLQLVWPPKTIQLGGKDGLHTEYLGFVLAEMQSMQRTYPGLKW